MTPFTKEEQALAESVIAAQLAATAETVCTQRNGDWETTLTPVVVEAYPTNNIIDLSGSWAVARYPFSSPEEDLAAPGLYDLDWEHAEQPGRIFTADPNYDPALYGNWDRIRLAHIDDNDGAVIRRTVTVPKSFENKEIFLCCDAIYPAGRVYVNGKLVADHRSGLTPVCRNVTDLVTPGQTATVAIRILRKHPFIMMDMPRHSNEFGGMAQPAYLFAKERCHVEDYYLPATLEEDLVTGHVKGWARLRNSSDSDVSATLKLILTDPNGAFAGEQNAAVKVPAGQTVTADIDLVVNNPMLWNDEHPFLYSAQLDSEIPGVETDVFKWRVGFRRMDFKDCRPYLNGNPIKFRGVNHLTGHPQYGLYTPKEWLRRNFELMKLANVNCIRTHFMGPRWLADLCDEMGIYLAQELPVDWGTHYIHDPEWVGPALFRLQGGICRDRNHPSVMVWSIGNENMPESDAVAANGWMHLRMYERFAKRLDPNGLTMFPPPGPAWAQNGKLISGIFELRMGDIADTHYSFKHVKRFLAEGKCDNPYSWEATMETDTKEEALARGWSGTWFSSEFMGFSAFPDIIRSANCCIVIADDAKSYPKEATQLEAFDDLIRRDWGFIRSEPSALGAAYFPWMSSGSSLNLGHPFSWTVLSEDCDWGVMTPELLPKPTFWSLRNALSPIWFPDEIEWFEGDEGLRFELWNQYNDINLAECTIRVTDRNSTMRWHDFTVNVKPGERREVIFPIWSDDLKRRLADGGNDIFRFWLIDPKGFVSTVRDVTVFSGKRPREEAGTYFDVGPEPAYLNKKDYTK